MSLKNWIIVFILFAYKGYSQEICVSDKVMPIESFNLCTDTKWILTFEDTFDGNSLDLSKWNIITGVARDYDFNVQKA